MTRFEPSGLMYQIAALKEDLENRSASILGSRRFAFQLMHLRSPRVSPPELAFYQVITWLYGFYYEAGRVSFRFLLELLGTYGLADGGNHGQHYEEVQRLRTFLQHNLNLDSEHDQDTRRVCDLWFLEACGSVMPGDDCEWNRSVSRILLRGDGFLSAMVECVRAIEKDDACAQIVAQWSTRLTRYHYKYEFEEMAAIVINDLGQGSLDPVGLTERHYDKWTKVLRYRHENYVFEDEARRLIEQTLLSEDELPLPISGHDLMRILGIPHGREVGRWLREARALYLMQPCGRDQLLARLKEMKGSTC